MMDNAARLVNPATLARSAVLNTAGTVLPLLAGIIALPVLVAQMGVARVGLLSIAWALAGTFSILDFGLGRALTHSVATAIAGNRAGDLRSLFWTYLVVLACLGTIACICTALASGWLVEDGLKIAPDLRDEARVAFLLLAPTVPLVMLSVGLRGFLEAHQRFDMVTTVRIPTAVLMFVGPALVAFWWPSLIPAVALLFVSRLIAFGVHLAQCLTIAAQLRRPRWPSRSKFFELARFGGWMTLGNAVSPLLVQIDRFIIGAVVSAASVAYYTTPGDVVTRLALIPLAFVPVVFPAFAVSFTTDRSRAARLLRSSTGFVVLLMIAPAVVMFAFAEDLLHLWLDEAFAERSTGVAQILVVGGFLNGAAQAPLALIQGAGRPDLAAKLLLVEVVVFVPLMWLLVRSHGIEGAAAAWTARAAVDGALLFGTAAWLLPGERVVHWTAVGLSATALGLATTLAFVPLLSVRLVLVCAAVSGLLVWGWRHVLGRAERRVVKGLLHRGVPPGRG
jgi:O-antigen/teichoic acid export membrane protein